MALIMVSSYGSISPPKTKCNFNNISIRFPFFIDSLLWLADCQSQDRAKLPRTREQGRSQSAHRQDRRKCDSRRVLRSEITCVHPNSDHVSRFHNETRFAAEPSHTGELELFCLRDWRRRRVWSWVFSWKSIPGFCSPHLGFEQPWGRRVCVQPWKLRKRSSICSDWWVAAEWADRAIWTVCDEHQCRDWDGY